jgi:LPS export ABC transporter protein LptC
MENVDYVRVRSADPLARILAERVERFERQNLIKLQNATFEQYGERGEEVNMIGRTGNAIVEIDSGDIFMDRNVRIEVITEDITIETYQLEWRDEPKTLLTGDNNEVFIFRDNGTRFTGIGLHGNARNRTWEFVGNVRGTYIHTEEDD